MHIQMKAKIKGKYLHGIDSYVHVNMHALTRTYTGNLPNDP